MKIKHLFIGILLATTALNVAAQPVSKQYFVPKAGTLISLMTEDEANSITHLTLTGKIPVRAEHTPIKSMYICPTLSLLMLFAG